MSGIIMHKTCRQYKLCRSFTTSIYFKAQFDSCKHDSAVMLLRRLLQLSKKASFNWDLLMIHHSHTTLTCKFSIASGIFHIILITFIEDMVILGILNYFLVMRIHLPEFLIWVSVWYSWVKSSYIGWCHFALSCK